MRRFAKSRMAARLQMMVSEQRLSSALFSEIASHLPLKDNVKVLDIGTGTGCQLEAIHDIHPSVQLFGLDISKEAISLAKTIQRELPVDLRQGSIECTNYADDFFDLVICNASMSYWENIIPGFNEIHRILKPGGYAVLIEPHADIDVDQRLDTIRENMADAHPLQRWLAVTLNRFGLKRGSRVGMRVYKIEEIETAIKQSLFKGNGSVEKITLQRIPIFMKITLNK